MKRLRMYSRTCFVTIMDATCHGVFWKQKSEKAEVSGLLHRYFVRNLISTGYIQLKYTMRNLRWEKYVHKAMCFCCIQQEYDGFMWSCIRHPLLHSPSDINFMLQREESSQIDLSPNSRLHFLFFTEVEFDCQKGIEQAKEKRAQLL